MKYSLFYHRERKQDTNTIPVKEDQVRFVLREGQLSRWSLIMPAAWRKE